MTTQVNNGILPAIFKDIYFQSGMADSGETFFYVPFVPSDSGTHAVHYQRAKFRDNIDRKREVSAFDRLWHRQLFPLACAFWPA